MARYVCMPRKENVKNPRNDWTETVCPVCGSECYRHPLVTKAELIGCVALCTLCALKIK